MSSWPIPKLPSSSVSHSSVLLRACRIGELGYNELEELVADAWLTRAPKRLSAQWLRRRNHGWRPGLRIHVRSEL